MADLSEKTISSKVVFQGNLLTIRDDTVLLPNGQTSARELVVHPGASAVVAVDHDGLYLFVRQFRTPVGQELFELPAGKLDFEEDPLECAKRELREETGFSASTWQKLTSIHTTPGFTNEVIHLFLATGLVQDPLGKGGDSDEFIEVHKFSEDQLRSMISKGQLTDAKTLAGLLAHWVGKLL